VTVLPQLRAEVVAAVAAPRRRTRVPLTPVFAVAAVAVTVAIVLLALPGKRAPDAPVQPIGAPPASQLLRYGVLRRAPTPADREALRTLTAQMSADEIAGVREEYVRAVGRDLILYSLPTSTGPVSVLTSGAPDPLCLYVVSSGVGCWSAEQLAAGKSFGTGTTRVGLVPDGVTSVTLQLDDGTEHTATVHDNVYEVEVSAPKGVAPDVRRVTWRAEGDVTGP
jgi:hypothetical protein